MSTRLTYGAVAGLIVIVAAVIASTSMLSNAQDAPPVPSLSIRSPHAVYDAKHGRLVLSFAVVNDGPGQATVITHFYETGISTSADKQTVVFTGGLNSTHMYKNYLVVPPITACDPVTIGPGEAVNIRHTIDVSRNQPAYLTPENGEAMKMVLRYHVAEPWGKRFGLWEGKLTAEPTELLVWGAAGSQAGTATDDKGPR